MHLAWQDFKTPSQVCQQTNRTIAQALINVCKENAQLKKENA